MESQTHTELVAQPNINLSVNQHTYQVTTFGELESGYFFLTPRMELAVKVGEGAYLLPAIKDQQFTMESSVRVYLAEVIIEAQPILSQGN